MGVSFLDRVILELSPARGHARIRAKSAARVLMNYDAATTGRRAHGWKAPGSSAEAAAMGSRARMRNLARDFVRNRELAQRAVAVIASNVVGTGIAPAINLPKDLAGRDDLKAEIEAAIGDHLMTTAIDAQGLHNLPSFQRLAMATVVTDGEILFRRRWRNNEFRRGLVLPFQIEALEADHLDETLTSYGGNDVINGVEISPTGSIVAYHFRTPEGTIIGFRSAARKAERVIAADVLHIRRLDRPGQLRGVTWFAPVMLKIGELSDYQEAEILKQKMAALLAGVIETDLEDTGTGPGTAQARGLEDLAPGALVSLSPGQKVSFTTPPKVDSYEAFMRGGTRSIAIGLGLTYEALSGDLSGVNFSSGRMGRMEMGRNIAEWQELIMILQFCEGVGRFFSDAWRVDPTRKGTLPPGFWLDWTPPRPPVIDPAKEIPAAIKEIEAGLTSRSRKQRELGLDPDMIQKERLEDLERDKAYQQQQGGTA